MKLRLRKKKELTVFKQVLPDCLNCGKPLDADDNFCSYCGQKNVEKLSFGSFLGQLVSGFFNYDSRFWTTFSPLLLKPGKVSRDYIEGKRKRYVNPFQLYLHVSILFFLILGLTNNYEKLANFNNGDGESIEIDSLIQGRIPDEVIKELDSSDQKAVNKFTKDLRRTQFLKDSIFQYKIKQDSLVEISFSDKLNDFSKYQDKSDSIVSVSAALKDLGYPETFWNTFYYNQIKKIKTSIKDIGSVEGRQDFFKKVVSKLSIGLFIFLPLFALAFKILYYRKHMNYMEHLVFVFHTQTVFFLLMTIFMLLTFISNFNSLWAFLLLFLIYLFLALRKFYQQGRFKTFIKFMLLNFIYTQIGGIAVVILAILAFIIG